MGERQYPRLPEHAPHEPLVRYIPPRRPEDEARAYYQRMKLRRSVRMFSDKPVFRETIEWCIRAAGTSPSGANKQPWRFIAISNPDVKRQVRLGAGEEERAFLLIPVGYPTDECRVPRICRRPLEEISAWVE
ncbi:MAG: hypothetical protein DYG94_04060 [Leptolyngbya sp. PLA3]|nr:MAG: hypothetical protein EDM82_07840 [Cyanobacteria bacterium CYA]MCE7967905.1 hypothetical protein [Leptolyngbya sp. PL-A3]